MGDPSHMATAWQDKGVSGAIRHNLKEGAGMMVAQLIAIPIIFKYGRKILGKSLIRPANRLLAPAGVRI